MATKFKKGILPKAPAKKTLRERLPPQVVEEEKKKNTSGGDGVRLSIVIPPETLLSFKTLALKQGSTVRAVILELAAKAGHPVPDGELTDRRKVSKQ